MTDEELITFLRTSTSAAFNKTVADRIEALVKDKERLGREVNMARYGQPDFAWSIHKQAMADLQARAERLEAAVIAAAKIGQIVGFLGEDEGRIEAFREACGPELWAKARAALKGADHD